MRIFITGAAGYIGGMLAERFARRNDIEEVIALDRRPITRELKMLPKVLYLCANTADDKWQDIVSERKPDVVIHCAWQIREFYLRKKLQERWNLGGSKAIIQFFLNTYSAKKLIFFSSVAIYGANPTNTPDDRFVEDAAPNEPDYRYGREKGEIEEYLKTRAELNHEGKNVIVLRPVSVIGRKFKKWKRGINLQSWLRSAFPFFPIGSLRWARQFIHENDLCESVFDLVSYSFENKFTIYNVSPDDYVTIREITRFLKKRIIPIDPMIVRATFFLMRHLSFGSIPTSPGGWKFYCYPIIVNGRKLSSLRDTQYIFSSKEAFERS